MISGGVAFAVVGYWHDAQIDATTVDARQIRHAVKAWWLHHDDQTCPALSDLVPGGALDRDNRLQDAWGEPWQLDCQDGDVTVTSAGPDRSFDTADDIRIPPT